MDLAPGAPPGHLTGDAWAGRPSGPRRHPKDDVRTDAYDPKPLPCDAPRVSASRRASRTPSPAPPALRRQLSFDQQGATFTNQIAQQSEFTAKLKDGLNKLRLKREEPAQKRDELLSRAKMAQAQMQVQQTLKDVSILDPTSELNRFKERIRRVEAQARGVEEVGVASLEDQFAQLRTAEDDLEVEIEVRLAELKGQALGSGTPAVGSGEAAGG